MKNLVLFFFLFTAICNAQTAHTIAKKDNYTIFYLHIINDKNEILMQKNEYGWNPLALRSNQNLSIKEALDSLASSKGIKIDSFKLAGLYTYKFQGLPDHKEMSFRSHYKAKVKSGKLIETDDKKIIYSWFPIEEALKKIEFEALKIEMTQLFHFPNQIWGGSSLIIWEGDKLIGSKVLEPPYPLTF